MKRWICFSAISMLGMAFSCEQENTDPKDFLQYCDAPNGTFFSKQTAIIMKGVHNGQEFYYLGNPPAVGGSVICNLQEEFKKEGLKVKYSGFQKDNEYPDEPLWSAIELSEIVKMAE